MLDIIRSEEYTVGEWVQLWYEVYAKPSIRLSTASYYKGFIDHHIIPEIGNIKLNKLTSRTIQKLYNDLKDHGRIREAQKEKKTGGMYHPDSVVNLHKRILRDAGLEHIPFHALRHTFATTALQTGIDVKTVSSMLGHYSTGFTLNTYTHATTRMQKEAASRMGSYTAQNL